MVPHDFQASALWLTFSPLRTSCDVKKFDYSEEERGHRKRARPWRMRDCEGRERDLAFSQSRQLTSFVKLSCILSPSRLVPTEISYTCEALLTLQNCEQMCLF